MALTWKDVDFAGKIINVDKTALTVINRDIDAETTRKVIIDTAKTEHSTRTIPMNKNAERVFLVQKSKPSNDILVFSSKNSTIQSYRNIRRSFGSVLKKADLPDDITIHTLRHTFATRLLEKGANIKVVSDILGHTSTQITFDIYSHVLPNLKRDVINLLD